MAFQKPTAGERLNLWSGTCVPKRPVAGYTTPVKGHLVKQDTTGNDLVNQCAAGEVPYGFVYSTNNGNGVLSIVQFRRNAVVLEYTGGTFLVGDKIVANGTVGTIAVGGTLRDQVKRDNSIGIGIVHDKDVPATGLCVVEFP